LFLKLHGVVRPLSLKTDVIKKRNRGSGTTIASAGTGRSSKKSSRKNSIVQTPATTPTSGKAANESESPKSTAGSATGSTNSANTGSGVIGTSHKSGVVPIAPGPPKSQQSASSTAPVRSSVNVASKRLRRHSKSGLQELDMADADDTSGKTAPLIRKKEPSTISQTMGMPQGFPGALGQGVTSAAAAGPQEWEWLTMSL